MTNDFMALLFKTLEPEVATMPDVGGMDQILMLSIAISQRKQAEALKKIADDLGWCVENGFPVGGDE